ncbi:hypothetical protein GBA52_014038 [Prunus armeniaca]|nr:hypothetical protein GBA52_014038 [Prunus armeniaca]
MGRKLSGDKDAVKRGAWCPKEDKVLADYIKTHGEGKWSHAAKKTGCDILNYSKVMIRWALIARRLPGRTDNEIKNFWNINLSKRVPEARPHRIKINAKNDGADEGGNCTAKDDQVQVIQSITLNCTKAAAMIPSHHHLHDGDQRVNIQDQRVVDDISSSSFLRTWTISSMTFCTSPKSMEIKIMWWMIKKGVLTY